MDLVEEASLFEPPHTDICYQAIFFVSLHALFTIIVINFINIDVDPTFLLLFWVLKIKKQTI
jgi:hypothetical protein